MKRAKNKGDGIDRYWRAGIALLWCFGVIQLVLSVVVLSMGSGQSMVAIVLLFGSAVTSQAVALIKSLNQRVEMLEHKLEELEQESKSLKGGALV